ncbi:acyl-CoA thioesterase domain-containing protein [Erythrobacter crassostreae]|uniref:Thioesterase family protein n=1 Tax=Erythrobacter crassostreae TaxID=2828328 RepID=A0A9X1JNE7_9SPHN|nr:acyl-CoA thioesterase domain-containing protein [Erythrobacter crassostrea]MBV7260394.1 thioesterase family protein [Erythrobacter crassostrea]
MLNLDLQSLTERHYAIQTDQAFWNFNSAFGGWLAAVVIAAVKLDSQFRGEIITKQMQFVAPVKEGQLHVSVDLSAQRRTTDFWRVSVSDEQGRLLVTADIAAAIRGETDLSYSAKAPETGAADQYPPLEASALTPKWLSSFDQHMVAGKPLSVNEQPKSVVLLRPKTRCTIDAQLLAMICDTPMPRTFFASQQLRFASTISLSTHIYCRDDQMPSSGGGYLILETNCAAIHGNTANQEVRVFREDGLLLATSYQTSIFR